MNMKKKTTVELLNESEKASLYSISFEMDGTTEFEKFVAEFEMNAAFNRDYQRIIAALQAILRIGAILMAGDAAAVPDKKLVKKTGLRPGQRKLQVFCLDEDTGANMRFASALLEALNEIGIDPSQTALSAVLRDEEMGSSLQAAEDRYGYGSVLAAGPMDLSAKLLINYAK